MGDTRNDMDERERHTASHTSDAIIVAPLASDELTLFGVLYGVTVTVVGVVVAILWHRWWAAAIYAVISLAALLVLLLFYGQQIVIAMRWLMKRSQRVPPWPFRRRWTQPPAPPSS